MSKKLRIPKALMEELLAEVMIEEGHYADPKETLTEAFEAEVEREAEEPENAPISNRETLSLKAKAIKEGIETWTREFKVDPDTIQLQHGNKAVASDGSGNSYYMIFKVNSWNPPAVEITEIKLVDIDEFGDEGNLTENFDSLVKKESDNAKTPENQNVYLVYILHNYFRGKYYDYGVRQFPILANSEEEALQIANDNLSQIVEYLRTVKVRSGSRLVRLIQKNDKFKGKIGNTAKFEGDSARTHAWKFDGNKLEKVRL